MKRYNTTTLRNAIAQNFGVKGEDLKLIRSYSNLVYDAGSKIIRLTHSSLRPVANIEAELSWLEALAHDATKVVGLLQSQEGNDWEVIPAEEDCFFTAVAFEKLAGQRISNEEWTTAHFENLGHVTAGLHRHSQEFKVPAHISYPVWDEIIEHQAYQYAHTNVEEYSDLHQQLTCLFNSYPKRPDQFGLVHYDIHHGNYFAQPDGVVVFDFEMVCYCWYMHDVATVLYYASLHPGSAQYEDFETLFLEHFWKGYETICQLDLADRKMIQPYLLYRDLMVYGYLGKVWKETELSEGDAAYLARLKASIEKRKAF